MTLLRRSLALFTAACVANAGLLPIVQATPISTEQVAAAMQQSTGQSADHQRLLAALDRDDLSAALQARGVSDSALRERVQALTDAEAAQLNAQIDSAPAGADVLGVLFSVFIVLLVTDVLGFTKVFPFTRSVR